MQVRRWPPACVTGLMWLIPALAVPAAASPAAQPAGERSVRRSQETCLACHGDRELGVRTPQGQVLSLHVDAERYHASVHGGLSCVSCHDEMAMHGGLAAVGTPSPGAPSPDAFAPAERACATCHPEASKEYGESAHAAAARGGNRDAPTCKDCHGAHEIRRAEDLESSTSAANVPATCARCHAQSTMMARYDINTRVVDTYQESFHGKKSNLGSARAAVCTSCHGVHGIRGPADPKSHVFAANRPQTCGQEGCHPGASLTFGLGFSHQAVSRTQKPLSYWVQLLYMVMIAGTIGGMFLYMGADLLRRILRAVRRRMDAPGAPTVDPPGASTEVGP